MKKAIIITTVIIAAAAATFWAIRSKKDFSITNVFPAKTKEKAKTSSIAGLDCANKSARPIAVMMPTDQEARPLSGIGQADMVFEVPVVQNGMNRMMAVFQCQKPNEIGSVRSSRLDFVPLALGLNAIYAHFGGEHTVLEELNSGIIDNIDGLKYDGTIYYRKKNIRPPHNAFTSYDLLTQVSTQDGYSLADTFSGYPREENAKSLGQVQPSAIYPAGFKVNWVYNSNTNSYLRERAGRPEMDKNTGKQVEAKNVVYMQTTWSPIDKNYIRVKTVGTGTATIYKDGQAIIGTWQKKDDHAKLYFYGPDGREVQFAPGSVWIQIVIGI